jgi:predicted NBD/HSP70 family sugar kinase
MPDRIEAKPKIPPPLDPDFVPAALWNKAYRELLAANGKGRALGIALERGDGSASVYHTRVFPHDGSAVEANRLYVERLVKFLLWQKGGCKVILAGEKGIADYIADVYSPSGARAFDHHFMGEQVYGSPMTIEHAPPDTQLHSRETTAALGRHFNGCRIGFDLGGSDRKSAAVIDGEVVFSEEIPWDPYFKTDPGWHFEQIDDTLRRAASHMPRVDAIGGSSAGVYVNNEVRVASLFRGVPRDVFNTRVRRIFADLKDAWGGIPFVVVNDGEVTALAGSMALEDNAVLGVAMGTSQAAGYVTPQGTITNWLNELAFAPLDYRPDAHIDEWSGDAGCGAQYFSQQAVGRLHRPAGIELPEDMPLPERLIRVQKLMESGDERARLIYETMGVYFGYTVAHYADFYDVRNLLVLGRVMTGKGGDLILATAKRVLAEEFPELAARIHLQLPGEKEKRHGQAVAAASLPVVE